MSVDEIRRRRLFFTAETGETTFLSVESWRKHQKSPEKYLK